MVWPCPNFKAVFCVCRGTRSAPVSSASSYGSAVMLSDYDWVYCYSAYYQSYTGRRGDGIKWHDQKKVKNLHCIIKQQLKAIEVIYSWGLYTAVHLEIEADYLFAWPPITTQELVTSLASSISFYKQVRFNTVLCRKCVTYQPQWGRR